MLTTTKSAPILVLHDPATLVHKTVELLGSRLIPALECPDRITRILAAVKEDNYAIRELRQELAPDYEKAALDEILRASHDTGYLEFLQTAHAQWVAQDLLEPHESILPECFPHHRLAASSKARLTVPPTDIFARPGYYSFDMSAGIAQGTWKSALASANLAVEAAKIAAQAAQDCQSPLKTINIFALCRPPGHHCTTNLAGGYCYLNNAVVTVGALRRFHLETSHAAPPPRIAILDLDFHHGNGTQDHFYADPLVFYASIHGKDEYPYYSGSEEEVGQGTGQGFNLNLPLPSGSSIHDYLRCLGCAVDKIERFQPDFLVVSLGFDTFHLDPLGSFKIYSEDYCRMAARVRSTSCLSKLPSIILLEGGYALDQLGVNVSNFLHGWCSTPPSSNIITS